MHRLQQLKHLFFLSYERLSYFRKISQTKRKYTIDSCYNEQKICELNQSLWLAQGVLTLLDHFIREP